MKKKKVDKHQAFEIRKARDKGYSFKEIAAKYGVSISVAQNICAFRTHKYGALS